MFAADHDKGCVLGQQDVLILAATLLNMNNIIQQLQMAYAAVESEMTATEELYEQLAEQVEALLVDGLAIAVGVTQSHPEVFERAAHFLERWETAEEEDEEEGTAETA